LKESEIQTTSITAGIQFDKKNDKIHGHYPIRSSRKK